MSEPENQDPKPSGPAPAAQAGSEGGDKGERKRRRRRNRRSGESAGAESARSGAEGEGAREGQSAGDAGKPARTRRRRSARTPEGRRRTRRRDDEAKGERKRRRRRRDRDGASGDESKRSDRDSADRSESSAESPPGSSPGSMDSSAAEGDGSRRRRRRRRPGESRSERARSQREERRRRRRRRSRDDDSGREDRSEATSREADGDSNIAAPGQPDSDAPTRPQPAIDEFPGIGPSRRRSARPDPALADDDATDEPIDFGPPPAGPEPDPAPDDPDPVSFPLESLDLNENRALKNRVRNLVGVKFTGAGRIYTYDAGNRHYRRGEEVMVESERGARRAIIAVPPSRRVHSGKAPKRVLRTPDSKDRALQRAARERADGALGKARALAKSLSLPIKVYRAEMNGSNKKLSVYFTSEERVDFRAFVKRLTSDVGVRVEMRQTGVRDEAKAVGGIGSCGMELCCTTWLPEFVPVSIKMAKDQGLVLNPTKVSGQCGRLKCCLVYEQETYAAMRKGLPKLGKRVITEAGEGRVVEVDVLRQRVRVSLGPGDFQVFPGHEVKPKFPSQQPRPPKK